MLQLDDGRVDGTLVLHVRGEVDSSNAASLRERLRQVPGRDGVVVDLRDVSFMDSAGLGALVCGIRELRIRDSRVALCVRRGSVLRLLSVTGFDRIVPTAHSPHNASEAIADPEHIRRPVGSDG